MAHKNYGAIGHTNTGYNNHSNVSDYHQSGYNNWVNTKDYHQSGYNNHENYSDHHNGNYNNHTNYSRYSQHNQYGGHGNYAQYSQSGYNNWENYSNHHNANYNNHTNYGDHHNANYNNHTNYGDHHKTGSDTHANTGYTNHVNTTTNVAPTNVSNVSKGAAVYYKDSINLTWTAATDNNKVISVVSRNTGSGGHADNGIWENTVQKQAAVRSWAGAYWNENGTYGGSIGCDVYGNAAQATTFINWLNSVNSVAKRYVAILGFDEPYTNASAIINQLKSWGFSTLSAADTSHFVFVGITQTGVGVKSQQTVRRYGTSDVRAASCFFTIPGVSSGQTISYYIDYCFKPIGGAYGSWTRIGTTTGTSYSYNLSSHSNGHIKFRVLSTDGVENGSSWIESPEVRVLKYTAPSSWGTQEKITASDFESLRLEINKLAGAVGTATSSSTATAGNIISKAIITDMRDKIKLIGPQISKAVPGDSNLDIIRKADIDNLKNWLKGV